MHGKPQRPVRRGAGTFSIIKNYKNMKYKIMMLVIFTLALMTIGTFGMLIGSFPGWDRLEGESSDIAIIYTQDPTPPGTVPFVANAPPYDYKVDILSALKGTNTVSSTRFFTEHELRNHWTYLVFGNYNSLGLNAIEDFRVVPLNNDFTIDSLKGKTLNEQLEILFQIGLDNINQKIEEDEKEKDRLQEGVLQHQEPH
jgi:hypothetical protein